MNKWEVTAELNMDASNIKSIIVKANTQRKAHIIAEDKLKKDGAFFVRIEHIKKVEENNVHS